MDDEGSCFKDRVNKVFASISSSSSSWSVADAHRDTRDDDEEDQIPLLFSSNIRSSSIGLGDSTLNPQQEEADAAAAAAYDKNKMAQGRRHPHGPFFNSHHHHHHHASKPIKSILKRRKTCTNDDELPKPPAKRVSFDSTSSCCNKYKPPHRTSQVSQNAPGVPDYILNPSRYTRYTFDEDSSHHQNEAYYSSDQTKQESSTTHGDAELPKSIVFIPRKKSGQEEEHVRQSSAQPCSTIGIAAQQGQEEMQQHHDHDHDVYTKASCQKRARQYRSKMEEGYDDSDDDDDVS